MTDRVFKILHDTFLLEENLKLILQSRAQKSNEDCSSNGFVN